MESIDGYLNQAWPILLNVIYAIVILIVGWIFANWVNRTIRRKGEASAKLDDTLIKVFAKTAKVLVLVVVVMAVLDKFGFKTTSLVAVVGALGLAIGMAWQGVLADFAAGIMILVLRPFKVGDTVDIAGELGHVEEVGLVTTRLNSVDNVAVIMPNSNVWGNNIKNLSLNDIRRVDMVIGFGYDDDIDHAKQTIKQVLSEDERILDDPAPQIAVSELGGSSVNVNVRPWTKKENYWALKFDLTEAIKKRFDEEGLNFPYPSQDIYFYNQDISEEGEGA
ncbi:mechanosensitive ion channel family protein [Fodinibius salsisoli]|uniref:Mechanosensitive ion channel family protein n=1 Tax=Fodinibius salsisoli TaxID=2820877 RepID=A0ABT3PSD4_9BACT|nr:mechanosensitive ion channel family protein [Fodinibius salsisoli]MCW9708746.1 mechanosensitive ion channel family protein [Fodinibius salsisoli]